MNSQTDICNLLQPRLALQDYPIGVFDSGIGGLTVVAALRRLLPHENILYVGDTARVPYGSKSAETILRYSQEIVDLLLQRSCKMIIFACNTASALALPTLKKFYKIPLQGVIKSGATAAVKVTRSKKIGIIGTKATIASNAYSEAIHALDPKLRIISQACPLLVPLIEEGWFENEITDTILHRYLDPMLAQNIDTLVLGCTHYPLLKKRIAALVGPSVTLVDSAAICAAEVQLLLSEKNLTRTCHYSHNKEGAKVDRASQEQDYGLARIFHHSHDEEAANADGTSQAPNLDDGCMYPYCPSPSSSLRQYPSAFPASTVKNDKMLSLEASQNQEGALDIILTDRSEDFLHLAAHNLQLHATSLEIVTLH